MTRWLHKVRVTMTGEWAALEATAGAAPCASPTRVAINATTAGRPRRGARHTGARPVNIGPGAQPSARRSTPPYLTSPRVARLPLTYEVGLTRNFRMVKLALSPRSPTAPASRREAVSGSTADSTSFPSTLRLMRTSRGPLATLTS
jgi:hypothetical protein